MNELDMQTQGDARDAQAGGTLDVEALRALRVKKTRQKRVQKIMMALAGVALFFFLTTLYSQYQVYGLKRLATAYDEAHPEVPTTPDQIVEAVSRHILLPDTVPQIASVQDAQKLSSTQTFFQKAENGDVVLVYDTTIYLYRPSKDLLIAVGDIAGKPQE